MQLLALRHTQHFDSKLSAPDTTIAAISEDIFRQSGQHRRAFLNVADPPLSALKSRLEILLSEASSESLEGWPLRARLSSPLSSIPPGTRKALATASQKSSTTPERQAAVIMAKAMKRRKTGA
jgi:hypothetical protein